MESGSSNRESKVDEAAMSSPGQAPAEAPATPEEVVATVSPPAPAAAASPRPYYECVFCKRGFTTAQALGGHMNIHRRDRAKPAPAGGGTTTVSRTVECYNKYRHLLSPYPSAPMAIGSSSSSSNFGMYYSSTGVSSSAAAGDIITEGGRSPSSSVNPRELSLFAGGTRRDHDLHLGLGCQAEAAAGDGSCMAVEGSSDDERHQAAGGEPERTELDLELRLGRRPRH